MPAESSNLPPGGPPSAPYGPNTRVIRRFLQRFAALDSASWDRAADLFAEREGTRPFAVADQALGLTIERAGRTVERDAVLGPVLQLVRLPDGTGDHPVAAAVLGAVLALLVQDIIDDGAFGVLYEPFAAPIPIESLFD